jgi:hypothetical protein
VEQRRARISTSRHATLQRLAARIRGRQTIAGLLAGGLNSSGPFYMGAGVYIDGDHDEMRRALERHGTIYVR